MPSPASTRQYAIVKPKVPSIHVADFDPAFALVENPALFGPERHQNATNPAWYKDREDSDRVLGKDQGDSDQASDRARAETDPVLDKAREEMDRVSDKDQAAANRPG